MLLAESFEKLDGNSGSTWYAVYTRHQHEKTVAQVLTMKGFETLLPLYQEPHRWKDRVKLLSLPLFPCYVFLAGDLNRRVDIVTTPGIHFLVSVAGRPVSIVGKEIDAIRQGVETGARLRPHPFLKSGERVRVKSGSLEGVEGILVRKKSVYRLVLSVEILGKAASVEVDVAEVERLKRASYSREWRGRYGVNNSLRNTAPCLS
jgi:transcription antitermination factor NusG